MRLHPDFLSCFPHGRHCSALSDVCLFDFLPIPTLRGAGGGDGEPRDGEPARETEAPAPAPRTVPVPPARVFTRHTHQVRLFSLPKVLFHPLHLKVLPLSLKVTGSRCAFVH